MPDTKRSFREIRLRVQYFSCVKSTGDINWERELSPRHSAQFHHLCRLNHQTGALNRWEVLAFMKALWEKCPFEWPEGMEEEERQRILDYLELITCWQCDAPYKITKSYAWRNSAARALVLMLRSGLFYGSAVAVGWGAYSLLK